MTASAGAWYRVGAVNVVSDQQAVTGVGSNWQNDVTAIAVGDIFTLDAKTWYEVIAVNSDTSITLDRGFEGSTQNAANYAIVRNTSGTILTRVAGQIAVQFNQKQLFLDELRKWLNSDNASEELTDSHGVKKSLKTPAQMVRDHDNKLAEIDAIHPYPWAMRKVEFEAMRAANKEKYAANGFVHLGKHYTSSSYSTIVQRGLWTPNALSEGLRLGASGLQPLGGDSKEDNPYIHIAGVITQINSIGNSSPSLRHNYIKLPPAEDGTRTYDSATGVSVTHATPTLAFAAETATNKVVTDRVDMWGFEAFLREINDNDPFVYKDGLPQSLASSINGVATVDDNVRPITYFAWYKGDTTSRGKGVNWQTATEAQRIAIASDRGNANRIYFDDSTGKFYQWCVLGRSFAGAGNGDWSFIENKENILGFSTYDRVYAKGISDSDESFVGSADANHYRGFYATANDSPFLGVFTTHSQYKNSKGVNGQCYFLTCGTINRLNTGAYHPSINPLGAAKWRDSRSGNNIINGSATWDDIIDPACVPTEKSQAFDLQPTGGVPTPCASNTSGFIDGPAGSGRSDDRYYDAIYASGQGGVCRDMRYSSWGVEAEDFEEIDIKIKLGTYRGRNKLGVTKVGTITTPNGAINSSGVTKLIASGQRFSNEFSDWSDFGISATGRPVDLGIRGCYIVGASGAVYPLQAFSIRTDADSTCYVVGSIANDFPAGSYNIVIYRDDLRSLPSVSDEYLHTEVVGHPSQILLCNDLNKGWLGTWNPVIPDGTTQTYKLTRPSINPTSTQRQIVTEDQGSNWLSGDATYNYVISAVTGAYSSTRVSVWQYVTKANVTIDAYNHEIYGGENGLGYVYASSDGFSPDGRRGRLLKYSLVGSVSGTISYNKGAIQNLKLSSFGFVDSSLLTPTERVGYGNFHSALVLDGSEVVDGFKALNYNVVKDQQAFIHYAYAQLTYDETAGDWGDDEQIHIADNQTTMLDENGHTNLVGTACSVEPIGWLKNVK
ncbi:hypothetical protein [Pseudoalteromonas shioyasakiensis]|uniref:hypothetical protein n=1 Tax=Pseudoalteromonas shioyasakiensis TaxID=1190813 RepID=UPI001C3D31CD|nr:hypothetical protein [Pseudoalteromonas shioyasakiensis]